MEYWRDDKLNGKERYIFSDKRKTRTKRLKLTPETGILQT